MYYIKLNLSIFVFNFYWKILYKDTAPLPRPASNKRYTNLLSPKLFRIKSNLILSNLNFWTPNHARCIRSWLDLKLTPPSSCYSFRTPIHSNPVPLLRLPWSASLHQFIYSSKNSICSLPYLRATPSCSFCYFRIIFSSATCIIIVSFLSLYA